MNAQTLLAELTAAGIRLSADGAGLHVDAPAGAVSAEMRQQPWLARRRRRRV
jgi:hypothetical protein